MNDWKAERVTPAREQEIEGAPLRDQKRTGEAEALFREAERAGAIIPLLVKLYEDGGRPEQTEAWRTRVPKPN